MLNIPTSWYCYKCKKKGKFKALDARISSYQEAYEERRVKEKEDLVVFTFGTFASSDPTLKPKLNQWIELMPKSYAARLARGHYYRHLGWLSRGAAYASETARDQTSRMRDYFDKALLDYKEAISLNPKFSLAYASLIEMAMAISGRREKEDLLKEALKIDPYSFEVRENYIFSLQPKWGGSLEKMKAFVKSTEQYLPKNPGLDVLRGYIHYTEADILKSSGKRREAIEFHNRAVRSGDHVWFLYERGRNYYFLRAYDKALEDFNRVLELWPQHPRALEQRAWTNLKQGRSDLALNDINLALKLDPLHPDMLRVRALLLKKKERFKEALQNIESAMEFGSYDAYVWWTKGKLQLYQFKDHASAMRSLKSAMELNPGKPGIWYDYSVALHYLKDCTVVDALEEYLLLCEREECGEKRRKWAKVAIPAIERAYCPTKFLDWRRLWRNLRNKFWQWTLVRRSSTS